MNNTLEFPQTHAETINTRGASARFGVSNDWLLASPIPRRKVGHRTVLWLVSDITSYLDKSIRAA